jgi:HAD superfamily hydrolase (TIGR01509 family)
VTDLKHDFSDQAVIFDLDGVLANTEPGIFRIHQEAIAVYGPALGTQDYHALFGLDYTDSAAYLINRYAIPESVPRLAEILRDTVIANISSVIEPISSSRELVSSLAQNGFRLGLASNSSCDYVHRVVKNLDLTQYFPAPVCRDEVLLGKPAPDPYLEACRRLGVDPFQSLAIEDSPTGMRSALAAGMDCAVVGATPPSDLPERASHYFSVADLLGAVLNSLNS